ncbi:MAG TPA: DUF2892 domain-containing protein [Phototrophicaceae bacterium]|nr:DUF2892 domain-containing protein [Phototrophicaceae bacterium]
MIAFLASPVGRILRIVLGIAIFAVGLFYIAGVPGVIVMALGFVPILAGILDFCLFAPLFGEPFSGEMIRQH